MMSKGQWVLLALISLSYIITLDILNIPFWRWYTLVLVIILAVITVAFRET